MHSPRKHYTAPDPVNVGAIGIGPTGQPFDVVVNDTNGVPDSGTTAMLLTAAFSGLGLARRFARP